MSTLITVLRMQQAMMRYVIRQALPVLVGCFLGFTLVSNKIDPFSVVGISGRLSLVLSALMMLANVYIFLIVFDRIYNERFSIIRSIIVALISFVLLATIALYIAAIADKTALVITELIVFCSMALVFLGVYYGRINSKVV